MKLLIFNCFLVNYALFLLVVFEHACLLLDAGVVPLARNPDVTAAVGRPPRRLLVNVGSRHTSLLLGETLRVVREVAPDYALG